MQKGSTRAARAHSASTETRAKAAAARRNASTASVGRNAERLMDNAIRSEKSAASFALASRRKRKLPGDANACGRSARNYAPRGLWSERRSANRLMIQQAK